jgi:hypothetical protein
VSPFGEQRRSTERPHWALSGSWDDQFPRLLPTRLHHVGAGTKNDWIGPFAQALTILSLWRRQNILSFFLKRLSR